MVFTDDHQCHFILSEIKKIGIVGAGKMGSSIFYSLLFTDYQVLLYHYRDANSKQKSIGKKIKRLIKNQVISQEAAHIKNITRSLDDLSDSDLIIEAIPEDKDKKVSLFQQLDETLKETCIVTTNSSSLLPSELVPSSRRWGCFAGLHFFFPVGYRNVVELITTNHIKESVVRRLKAFLKTINKRYLLLNEENAFVLNKLLLEVQAEACQLHFQNGFALKEIDHAVKEHLFGMGVFEMMDHIGLDVLYRSIQNYIAPMKDSSYYHPLLHILKHKMREGALGVKKRKGFYDYGVGKIEQSGFGDLPDEKLVVELVERLARGYVKKAQNTVLQTGISKKELEEAIKEFLGTEQGPFALAEKLWGKK